MSEFSRDGKVRGINIFPGCGGSVNLVPQCGCTTNLGSSCS